jgi:hypothetical protein
MALYTVTTLDDTIAADGQTSLREALALANADAVADEIVFDTTLSGTISLSALGQLTISNSVTINGDANGDGTVDITIDAHDASRVFEVTVGISTLDHLVMTNGRVVGAGADGGGILIAAAADLTILNSTISDSYAAENGGGIYNLGDLTLINSTLSGNTANGYGGGLHSGGLTATGETATLINTTLAGNSAYSGGGINNLADSILTLSSSTVSGNTATGTSGYGGGIYNGATATLTNSIVAGNNAATDAEISDLAPVTYTGVNVIGIGADNDDSDGVIQTLTLDALFDTGVLAHNGGPVQTIALQAGSAAEDRGDGTARPADTHDLDGDGDTAEPLPVDARGLDRIVGQNIDIGAFEGGQLVVTTLDDEDAATTDLATELGDGTGLSLREALAIANALAGADRITFLDSLAQGAVLLDDTLGELVISS